MTGPLLHVGAGISCPHGGTVQIAPGRPSLLLAGQPAATLADLTTVVGCAFTLPSGTPHPCVRVQWSVPAAKVLVAGQPALTSTSVGLALAADQAPQGPVIVSGVQPRVVAL